MKKQCECKPVLDINGKQIAISRSRCFVHAPETARHNARLDNLIAMYKKRRREK